VRSFALSLHFYSPKAYRYVREKFNNKLPSVSTIKSWYRVVDGSPGFTDESFKAIELRCKEKSGIINLVLDEMSIKEAIIYDKKEFHGGISFGTVHNFDSAYSDNDNPITAKNALVLMAVSMNENWKIPIGYFLIRSLNSEERANILTLAFELLQRANCKVYSITFDGAASNISMCNHLGANLNYGPNFKPYFTNPVTFELCYIFYDFCHMIKLIRNTLGDHKTIKTVDNKSILWSYIEKLYDLQCKEGLRVANKLTKKHIYYQNNKMNVKLAIQTLSESVSKALNFLLIIDDAEIRRNFEDSSETALFCLNFNNIGDMLNCKNKFSKDEFKTPNIFPLYDQLKKVGMSYLLTYKLSQDYIETFFSAIRSRRGFNNNPNVLQFKNAYKRLLIRHELKQFENGNCVFDNVDILHVSSSSRNVYDQIGHDDLLHNTEVPDLPDHDYIRYCWDLTPFVDNIVLY
ncbi:GSCOCG00010695001-RA-CDS, partial [Cotesia congregata]